MCMCTHACSLLHIQSLGCRSERTEQVAELCESPVAELGRENSALRSSSLLWKEFLWAS